MRIRDQSVSAETQLAAALNANGVELLDIPRLGAKRIGPKLIATTVTLDFVGVIRGSGKALVVESKSSKTKGGISYRDCFLDKEHQIDELKKAGQAGAVSGILFFAYHAEVQKFFWLPWNEVDRFKYSGKLQWDDPYLVFLGNMDALPEVSKIL